MTAKRQTLLTNNNIFIKIAGATGAFLLIPLVLSLLNPTSTLNGGAGGGWDWMPGDFLIMGALIFAMASGFVLTARRVPNKYHFPLGALFALALLWLWAELAVGIFTIWGS